MTHDVAGARAAARTSNADRPTRFLWDRDRRANTHVPAKASSRRQPRRPAEPAYGGFTTRFKGRTADPRRGGLPSFPAFHVQVTESRPGTDSVNQHVANITCQRGDVARGVTESTCSERGESRVVHDGRAARCLHRTACDSVGRRQFSAPGCGRPNYSGSPASPLTLLPACPAAARDPVAGAAARGTTHRRPRTPHRAALAMLSRRVQHGRPSRPRRGRHAPTSGARGNRPPRSRTAR